MACRQATEIDLAVFLLEPGGPEWTEFRTHYPQCQACAAEVRAWTELQSMLVEAGFQTVERRPLLLGAVQLVTALRS